MNTVHDDLETARAKLDAAITIAISGCYGEGPWFADESGRWAHIGLLERIRGHLKAAA